MKTMKSLFFCFAILFIASCETDDENTMDTAEEMDIEEIGFFNLRVGNIWTYEYFEREQFNDPLSDFISTGTTEVREVIERIFLDDETIYTIEVRSSFGENDFLSEFDQEVATYQVKDSLGYLVRINEGLQFSSENDEEYIKSSLGGIGDVLGILLQDLETVETTAGAFNCTVNEFFVGPDGEAPGREHSLMAEEIGEVLYRTSFVSNPLHIVERRLISFDFPE